MSYHFGQEYALTPFQINEESKKIEIKGSIHKIENRFQVVFTLLDPHELVILPTIKRENQRVQGLWNETCFEFFITDQSHKYAEGNFTLDFGWNVFWFHSYRQTPLSEFAIHENQNPIRDIYLSQRKSQIVVNVPPELIEKFNKQEMKFSLTTVVKLKNGNTLYYALSHKDKNPNFHHPESFMIFE